MKKRIWFTMTPQKAREHGIDVCGDLKMAPLEVNLDVLSPAARFIAEHITATRVYDEFRDVIDVWVEGKSKADYDRAAGKPEEYIGKMFETWGGYYVENIKQQVTFPIYGKSHSCPEQVIEETVRQLRDTGATRLYSIKGKEFKF